MANMTTTEIDAAREKLRKHFLSLPPDQQVQGWDTMWQQQVTPWDKHRPNPALIDTLASHPEISHSPFKSGSVGAKQRKKALVPGCGRGYDVHLLASYGFDAYGLDGSHTAIVAANATLQSEATSPTFPIQVLENGRGHLPLPRSRLLHRLLPLHPRRRHAEFDLIYDYTFLCALPPRLRPQWAKRMSELLAEEGVLICLEFPLGKDLKLGGPPFGLTSEWYLQLLGRPGEEIGEGGSQMEGGLERLEHWKPERTFEGQETASMVSIWRHRKS